MTEDQLRRILVVSCWFDNPGGITCEQYLEFEADGSGRVWEFEWGSAADGGDEVHEYRFSYRLAGESLRLRFEEPRLEATLPFVLARSDYAGEWMLTFDDDPYVVARDAAEGLAHEPRGDVYYGSRGVDEDR